MISGPAGARTYELARIRIRGALIWLSGHCCDGLLHKAAKDQNVSNNNELFTITAGHLRMLGAAVPNIQEQLLPVVRAVFAKSLSASLLSTQHRKAGQVQAPPSAGLQPIFEALNESVHGIWGKTCLCEPKHLCMLRGRRDRMGAGARQLQFAWTHPIRWNVSEVCVLSRSLESPTSRLSKCCTTLQPSPGRPWRR